MEYDIFKDILPNILQGKEPILEDEKEYNPWIVNVALSQNLDTILYAQEMNMNYNLDKKLQFDYLFYSVRKYKRPFNKWLKHSSNKEFDAIKEYFGYSNTKAKETINILSKDQIKEIVGKIESKNSGVKK